MSRLRIDLRTRSLLLALAFLAGESRGQGIETVAGGGVNDGLPASLAALHGPGALLVSASGDLYIADTGHHRIRRVDAASGLVSTVAGNGETGYDGDGGPATAARLRKPAGMALDAGGNLFIADTLNHAVRRVDRQTGVITTVAGTGAAGFSGDGGPAVQARLEQPVAVAVDPASGDLFVADSVNRRVRRVSGGTITTFAGTGTIASTGDGGPATAAALQGPAALLFDGKGGLLVADRGVTVRRITLATGVIALFAGSGATLGDGGPATAAQLKSPFALALDAVGNVLISDTGDGRVRRVSAFNGTIDTVAGSGLNEFLTGDGEPATLALLSRPQGIAVGKLGELYISDLTYGRVRAVSAFNGIISRFIGPAATGDGGAAKGAVLSEPLGLARFGNRLYIAERSGFRVRVLDLASGVISPYAGTGDPLDSTPADGAPATRMSMRPSGLAVDASGNLIITSVGTVFRVSASNQTITRIGNGIGNAQGAAVHSSGDVIVSDIAGNRIRRISATNGAITVVAGSGNGGFSGDGGPAALAAFDSPYDVELDAEGNLFVADYQNHRVRRIDAVTGVVTTYAGNGNASDSGDGGPATQAGLQLPQALALEANGDLLIGNGKLVRRVSKATGRIRTVAGTSEQGLRGDGGPATRAQLSTVRGLVVGPSGTIYVSEQDNDRVRALDCQLGGTPLLTLPPDGETTSSSTVNLSWSAVPFATRYSVFLDTHNPPTTRVANRIEGTTFTAAGLSGATTYFWSVSAENDASCAAPAAASSGVRTFRTPSPCSEPGDTKVCLSGERFLITGSYRLESGNTGAMRFKKLTGDSAYFIFENPSDAQALVKVLNVCFEPFNAIWVFVGALTDQEVNLTVTDTRTGATRSYRNPLKTAFEPVQDTEAFKTCP